MQTFILFLLAALVGIAHENEPVSIPTLMGTAHPTEKLNANVLT